METPSTDSTDARCCLIISWVFKMLVHKDVIEHKNDKSEKRFKNTWEMYNAEDHLNGMKT
jgi:hypothetical protein